MAGIHDHSHDDCSEHDYKHDHEHEHGDYCWIEMERIYQEKSTEEERLSSWFTENVEVYLPSAVASGGNFTSGRKCSILSFGCGNGTKDLAILSALSLRLSEEEKILYHAVDPAAGQIEDFKKAVQNENESRFKKVDFAFYVQTYENYMENNFKNEDSPLNANLILFIDSLCHFTSSTEDALEHCYDNVLAQNGVLLVTLWNDQDFWFKIREIYGKGVSSERKAKEGNDYLTVQEAEKIVKKNGWKYELFFPDYSLDITECFNPGSQDGRYLLDCLACFSNVMKEVESDTKKLLKFLQDSSSVSGDKHLLTGRQGCLIIYKQ